MDVILDMLALEDTLRVDISKSIGMSNQQLFDTIDELNDEKFKIKGLNEIMFSKIKPFISNSISDGVDRIKLYVDK